MQGFPTVFSFGKLPFYGNVLLINNRDCVDDGLVGRENGAVVILYRRVGADGVHYLNARGYMAERCIQAV